MKLSNAIILFLEHVEIGKNQSLKTVKNYRHYLSRFSHFVGHEIEIDQIDLSIVTKYRMHLNRYVDSHGKSLSKKTQNYHLIALRAFLKYLSKHDFKTLAAEKIELGKEESREVSFLLRDELEQLFKSIDIGNSSGLRDRAIIETLYSTGLRVSELVSLNRSQINLERGEFMVRGKGRKIRIVFLSSRCTEWLKKYLATRGDVWEPVFINYKKQKKDMLDGEKRRLTAVSVEEIVRRYARLAGIIKKVTPHTLRHSFATGLLMEGADIRSVQELLGHASISTKQVYTHITNNKLKEIHDKYHK